MAYTYDDFVAEANGAGIMEQFSEQDLQAAQKDPNYGLSLLRLKQDAAKATTEEQKLLTAQAESKLRSAYGTSVSTAQQSEPGSFVYQNQDAYQNILDEVTNRQPFTYNAENDPTWSAYKKMYFREGERATEDTLAKVAAASGGRPSSYAVSAAQQAGNYYSGKLADELPSLEQIAYSRYLEELNGKLTELNAYQSDRNMQHQLWQDQYQRELDEYNRRHQERLLEEELKQQNYNNAMALYQTLGYATPEVAAVLGIPAGTKANSSGSSTGKFADGTDNKYEIGNQTMTGDVEKNESEAKTKAAAEAKTTYAAYQAKKVAAAIAGKSYTTPTAQAFINRFAGYEDMGYSDSQVKALIENALLNSSGTFGLTDEDFWIINDRFGLGFEERMK